jgi:inosine/xanthosine triphosphatase
MSSEQPVIKIAVGTSNKSKIQAVIDALKKCNFVLTHHQPQFEVVGVSGVESNVSPQPFSASETRLGALNRARGALEKCPEAEFGIGLEGGIELVEDFALTSSSTSVESLLASSFFVVGWICTIHRPTDTVTFGSSSRVQLPRLFAEKLEIVENKTIDEQNKHGGSRFHSKRELAQVIDEVSKQHDLRSSLGVEGLLSNGGILRSDAYAQGIIFSFSKFLSPKGIW